MKIKDLKIYAVFFAIIFFIILTIKGIKELTYNSYLLNDIEMAYKAKVIELYNPREWVKEPNFMKLRKDNDEEINVYLTEELLKYIEVGDSLIKIKNENICYVKKPNGEIKEFYYTRISMKARSHWTFPKKWKNKWMESSTWDTISRN